MQYTTSAATTNDLMEMNENSTDPNTILTIDTTTPIKSEPTNEPNGESTAAEEGKDGKKPEYPMDAVLTLMQLNAGWRQ